MARYRATLETERSSAEVFAYLSDFSNTREWDPGVVAASRLDGSDVRLGSKFSLVAQFMGRSNQITYEIVEYLPHRAVTLLGENRSVVSRDRITFEPVRSRTRITYDAELAIKGPFKFADPLLGIAFKRVGDRALAGIERVLSTPVSLV